MLRMVNKHICREFGIQIGNELGQKRGIMGLIPVVNTRNT